MDTLFTALADVHRRRLLVALLEHDPRAEEPLTLPDAVHPSDRERKQLHLEMVHNHLPQLEAAGLIRWDREAHEVHRGPQFEEIRPLLELLDDNPDARSGEWV